MAYPARCLVLLWLVGSTTAGAQTGSDSPVAAVAVQADHDRLGGLGPESDPQSTIGWPLAKHLTSDQKAFWTSWKGLDREGATRLAFFAGFTGALIASDHWLAQQVPSQPASLKRSDHLCSSPPTPCSARQGVRWFGDTSPATTTCAKPAF